MSHDLELNEDGTAKAFFVGQGAWHGLGTILEHPPTLAEAIKIAGLDWTVALRPVGFRTNDPAPENSELETEFEPHYSSVPNHYATVRESDGKPFGIVGKHYVPLQNSKAFEFFQPFVDSKAVTLEAAGALNGGATIWVLAKYVAEGGAAEIVPGDVVENYLLLANNHNGKMAVRVGSTPVRVVCQNTLHAAQRGSAVNQLLKVRHTANTETALSLVQSILDTTRQEFLATADIYRLLAATGCSERTLRRYVRQVYEPGQKDNEEALSTIVESCVQYFRGGRGNALGKDTLWNAYNAITELITHGDNSKRTSPESRLNSQWFGNGATIIQRALKVALEISHNPKAF